MTVFPITYPVIILAGPTAVGKTALSIKIAQRFNCEIISVDSMQVYKYMDIGTAKVTEAEKCGIPHHLIDIADPHENYDAGRFVHDALNALDKIHKKGKTPLLTGGTGLYYKSLIDGISDEIPPFPEIREQLLRHFIHDQDNIELYEEVKKADPESARRLHQNDTQRLFRALEIHQGTGIRWSDLIERHQKEKQSRFTNIAAVCLTRPREDLYSRIDKRCEIMLEQGFEQEVSELLEKGYNLKDKAMNSIGYKHMCLYLNKTVSRNEMIESMSRDTRRYAKRQFTWFKKMDQLNWFDVNNHDEILYFLLNTVK